MLLVIGRNADASSACPDVTGRYSISGFSSALGDTLDMLHARQAGFSDSGIELHGAVDGTLSVGVKSGRISAWSNGPVAVLSEGKDFDCTGGALVFHPHPSASRKADDGAFYSGSSRVSLSRGGGDLAINVRFSGSQRTTLYSYDSANVSIPRFGTRTTLNDTIRWGPYTEPVEPVVVKVPKGELDVRGLLTSSVVGNVIMGWVSTEKTGVEVTFNAPHSDDIEPFEQRLHAAGIDYRMKRPPIWTNGAYYLVLVIQPPHGTTGSDDRGH